MNDYEKLGAFYLGRTYDPEQGKPKPEPLLYDSKDLTTHAVCVGMTGSGKTGLCLSLLEEAAIDGVPAIAIDPKGDLGNLLLTFPQLRPQDFRPWIDEGEAARKGHTADSYAADRAKLWKNGLAQWDQSGARIRKFREAVDLAIYTPGSSSGLPLTVLRSFDAPPPQVLHDGDALRERVMSTVSGLLALLGIDADPIKSREHILLSNVLSHAWRSGRSLDLPGLIKELQSPPFAQIGVLDLESFYPSADRFALAMTVNNLLASPSFSAWLTGEPLDIQRLLWTPEGKPRISILSIAHLSDAERMFLVTLVLNELLTWMRTQSGTSSLRALLYMDEVFGYFPPTANPPSKTPMLTLLKQARAYGLGVVLATQNPVDLDYKGLSNTGTWFLGRLQTERDKARVIEGLEGASATAGSGFDRQKTEAILAGLKSRVFLMNNVHDDEPALFHTRWALSYLRGPLTGVQIATLMADRKQAPAAAAAPVAPSAAVAMAATGAAATLAPADPQPTAAPQRPALPAGVSDAFIPRRGNIAPGQRLLYRPALFGQARLHFVSATNKVDRWTDCAMMGALSEDAGPDPWSEAQPLAQAPDLQSQPEAGVAFAGLPLDALKKTSYTRWTKALSNHLYRNHVVRVWKCKELKAVSEPDEVEGDFRARLTHLLHEQRDLKLAKLQKKFAPKIRRLQERIRKAEAKVEVQKGQYGQQKLQTAISVGATVLGALFGRKAASVGTVGRAGTAARGAGRTMRERGDVARALEDLESAKHDLESMEAQFQEALAEVRDAADPALLELEQVEIRPRKSDISVVRMDLVWTPWRVSAEGIAEPAF